MKSSNQIYHIRSSLKKVVIEKGVEVIGECAFRYCESLETLQLPETLKEIQRDAFRNNKALTSLDLPDSLESIRAGAFVACTELTKITFGSGLKEIGANAFQNDSKIKTLKFGGKVEDIDGYAFGFCTSLVSVDFPASLKSIGNNAFSDCTNLADINFSNGLTSISSEAFKNTALTSIVIPETVIEIRDRAFCDCPNLESAYILNSKIPSLSGFASNTKVTLYGMKDSVIQQYSKNIGVRFTALSLPTDLKAINNNYKSIKLTWSSVNGVNSYNIYRSTSENGTYKKIATISKNSYVDKAVTKAKSYYYKIEVLHKDTDGTVLSGIRTPDVSAGLRPKTPANFEFTRGYYSFSFSWDKVNDADGYIIYRNDIFHRKNIKVAVIKNASTVTFTDKLSYTDTVFEYKIVSYKKVNNELFYSLGNTITDLRTQR
jgi:hypothetical protein